MLEQAFFCYFQIGYQFILGLVKEHVRYLRKSQCRIMTRSNAISVDTGTTASYNSFVFKILPVIF